MRKIFSAIMLASLFLTGCSINKGGNADLRATEQEVLPVVHNYLQYSAAGKWNEVFGTLSGEALAEAKANYGRGALQEQIVSEKLVLVPVCRGIAEVNADFTKSAKQGFDRLAYTFRLNNDTGSWLIHKTTYGQYQHGELWEGPMPPDAAAVIGSYFEMPFAARRVSGQDCLAGRLLANAKKASLLPVDAGEAAGQAKTGTEVKEIKCLGVSENYLIASVDSEVTNENTVVRIKSVVDMVLVNGAWKICDIEVVSAGKK